MQEESCCPKEEPGSPRMPRRLGLSNFCLKTISELQEQKQNLRGPQNKPDL